MTTIVTWRDLPAPLGQGQTCDALKMAFQPAEFHPASWSARSNRDESAAIGEKLVQLTAVTGVVRPLISQRTAFEFARRNATFEALLRIAQLESGARRERFTEVSLGSVMSVLVEAYEDVALENGQSLTLSFDAGDPAIIRGDRDLLTQLFANLIENAIRHAKGGTAIGLFVHRQNSLVTARIVDDGPGIPKDESEKVFRRLYRLEKSRSTEGTGLGLSMVKAIADLHGATVALSSANPGLAVTVNFPAANGQTP